MIDWMTSIAIGAALFSLLRLFGLSFDGVSPWLLFGAAALCLIPIVISEVRRTLHRP